jgi:hypothetical protein
MSFMGRVYVKPTESRPIDFGVNPGTLAAVLEPPNCLILFLRGGSCRSALQFSEFALALAGHFESRSSDEHAWQPCYENHFYEFSGSCTNLLT